MKRNSGQSMVFVILFLMAIAVLILSVYGIGSVVRSRIRLQTAADAAARSAAVWKARTLNEVATLNSAAIACLGLSKLVRVSSRMSDREKGLWQSVLMSEMSSFIALSREVNSRNRWQAEGDAYTAAYATLSGGVKPGRVPSEHDPSIPRQAYGGMVVSGGGEYPPDFGAETVRRKWWSFGSSTFAILGLQNVKNPSVPLRSIAWYRGKRPALSPLIDRFLQHPTFCFAQADAVCPHDDGKEWLMVPSWRASLQRSSFSAREINGMLARSGVAWEAQEAAYNQELIRH